MNGNALALANDDMPMSDEDLLTEMVMALVDRPDLVRVETVVRTPQAIDLIIHTDPSDFGRVVGKNGRTVEAMRSFMSIVGGRHGRRINVSLDDGRQRRMANYRPNHPGRRAPIRDVPVFVKRNG